MRVAAFSLLLPLTVVPTAVPSLHVPATLSQRRLGEMLSTWVEMLRSFDWQCATSRLCTRHTQTADTGAHISLNESQATISRHCGKYLLSQRPAHTGPMRSTLEFMYCTWMADRDLAWHEQNKTQRRQHTRHVATCLERGSRSARGPGAFTVVKWHAD